MESGRERTAEERAYYARNERVYEYFAHFYDLVVFPLAGLRRDVARAAGVGAGSKALDVATGTGAQALAFAATCKEVVGVDLSEAMLRVARRKNHFPNLTFVRADATALPFEDASFDVACVSFALHEMPGSVRAAVLREMARVTRTGGTLVIVDYALPHNPVASALVLRAVKLYERDHYEDFVRCDLRAMLREAGVEPRSGLRVLGGVATVVTGVNSPATRSP